MVPAHDALGVHDHQGPLLRHLAGRLLRRADDKGVFVMLDAMLPTRLTTAFPEGVEVQRMGLAEAIQETRGFLND